jgi:hypothetical protein
VESLLVIRYGPQIVHELSIVMHRHMIAGLTVLAIILALLAIYVIRKVKGKK